MQECTAAGGKLQLVWPNQEETMSFLDLPAETLLHIFAELEDPADVSALSQCSRELHEIASDPLIWASHLTSYHHGNADFKMIHESHRRLPRMSLNAKEQFRRRRMKDRRIQKCVLSMVENPQGRLKLVDAISNEFLDAADAVRRLRLRHGRSQKNYGIDYYCCLIERHLSRKLGVHVLRNLAQNLSDCSNGMSAISALFAVDCFRRSDGLELSLSPLLDEMQAWSERWLKEWSCGRWEDLPLSTRQFEEPCHDKIQVLIDTLKEYGVTPVGPEDYHDLRNSFLSSALKEGRPTIPITLVAIFVALATRKGLKCYPIGFPGQVLAVVESENGELTYVSPYENGKVYTRLELVNRLHVLGLAESEMYLSPCSIEEFCIRSARNILNSIERGSDSHTLDGLYAALTTMRETRRPMPLSEEQFMTLICLHFPYDINFYGDMGLPEHQEMITRTKLEDVTIRKPKRRAAQTVPIRHRLGCIFRHRLFNYIAV